MIIKKLPQKTSKNAMEQELTKSKVYATIDVSMQKLKKIKSKYLLTKRDLGDSW